MNKQDYLANTYQRLDELKNNTGFRNNLGQVRARAIQEEFVPEQTETQFTFDPQRIWHQCDYIFSESALLLRENFGDKTILLREVKTAAQAFEFLAKFADEDEQEILLLNAAICYHIAGYQANALCISRLVESKFLPKGDVNSSGSETIDAILVKAFRQALLKFLSRDVTSLQEISIKTLSTIGSLQETVTSSAIDGIIPSSDIFALTAHAYFQQSLSDFVQYCLNGDPALLTTSNTNLSKSYRYYEQAGDVTLATITSELRTVFDLFAERSTWSNIAQHANSLLQERTWRFYLRNLALEKSIVEFWPAQLKAIHRNLLTSEDSFIVQMPTSAGKTFIAELAILAALTIKPQSRCLYIAPYRALVNEIESHLTETIGAIGYRVSTLIGGFEFDAFQDFLITQSDVLVATPEKIELLLRTNPEYFENLAVVIIDEGHILDEGIPTQEELEEGKTLQDRLSEDGTLGRGILLEFLVTRLKRMLSAKFIFLSAVMPEINANDFIDWLCESGQEPLRISRAERPTRQVVGKFEWRSPHNGEIEYISLPTIPPANRHPFVHAFLRRKQYLTGELTPTGRQQRQSWPDINIKSQTTALLAARLAKTGPVLVFCAQTSEARTVIENITTTLKYLEASNELPNENLRYIEEPELESFHEALEWLGEDHPLTKALHNGVALHYGPLPDPVRQAVEDEFRSNKIRILVSTNTLGQGVNLPIKTAVIHSLERRWSETDKAGQQHIYTSKLRKRDFWNICGRAGRAGKETEGQVIFVKISDNDGFLVEEFRDRNNLEEVESALYKLLLFLVEGRISQDELIGYLDPYILALLVEEIIDTQQEVEIAGFLKSSLVGIQAIRRNTDISSLVSAIHGVSSWVSNQVPDRDLRKVFATTGLRIASCQTLENAVDTFLPNANEELRIAPTNEIRCSDSFIQVAFRACQSLPEMRLPRNIVYQGPEDEFAFIDNWIKGRTIRELRTEFWERNASEAFSRYIADRITYKLPWGLNGFLRVLAFKLQVEYDNLPIAWQHLPAMMKFGVNDVFACWSISLGITSRNLALQLSKRYSSENGAHALDFANFAKWVLNLPNEFIFNELQGTRFELQRLLKVRNQIIIGTEALEFIREQQQELVSPIRGIPYENREILASQVRVGDELTLEPELYNAIDPYAVRVLYKGNQVGYVQRDKAKIVSRELQLDRRAEVYASTVRYADENYPYTWIEMNIKIA